MTNHQHSDREEPDCEPLACESLGQDLVGLVEGDLPSSRADALHAHAASCMRCGRLVARQAALLTALREFSPVPEFDVLEPELPMGLPIDVRMDVRMDAPASINASRRSTVRLAVAVALMSAAALLVAVRLGGGLTSPNSPPTQPGSTSRSTAVGEAGTGKTGSVPVEIRTVLAFEGTEPRADDELLALTAGVEAIVMRWPAEDRCANGLCASGR